VRATNTSTPSPVCAWRAEKRQQLRHLHAVLLAQQADARARARRTLHRDHRRTPALAHDDIERLRPAGDPGQVLLAGRGIDHQRNQSSDMK
jgi:hypothetical protein